MLIRRFVLKVINNEGTHHGIIDCIAEQIVLVITEVCKESKLSTHPNLRRPSFLFTYSIKFTHFYIADVWALKMELCLRKKESIHRHLNYNKT